MREFCRFALESCLRQPQFYAARCRSVAVGQKIGVPTLTSAGRYRDVEHYVRGVYVQGLMSFMVSTTSNGPDATELVLAEPEKRLIESCLRQPQFIKNPRAGSRSLSPSRRWSMFSSLLAQPANCLWKHCHTRLVESQQLVSIVTWFSGKLTEV